MDLRRKTQVALIAVIALQVVDAGLHIAINEAETLRIMSNIVLAIGVVLGVFLARSWRTAIWIAATAYVALNLIFVGLFGLENPVSGVNRTPLFGFMALSLWLTYRIERLQLAARTASSASGPAPAQDGAA